MIEVIRFPVSIMDSRYISILTIGVELPTLVQILAVMIIWETEWIMMEVITVIIRLEVMVQDSTVSRITN